jgi:hypothetical protein
MTQLTSNNSLNRSANSVVFIRETSLVIMARRARLIRALDLRLLHSPEEINEGTLALYP